ncbi:MAG TPA: proton-conducting transporter membrane subunit [Ornithinibacter sp.]|nr:proton-conducting transporter membrane subunit [Ornithinibacter sp.]
MNPWPIVLVPAVAAVVGLLVGRDERLSRVVAVGASGVALLLTLLGWALAGDPVAAAGPGLDAGELDVPLGLVSDPTRAAVAFVVALVALAVQVYSTWYLETDDRYPRFAASVSLFTSAMLLVVHSGDLVLTVIGWEVMGWCSYLLIGHWSRRASARRAAHKAFLVTRLADIGFALGVIGLAAGAGSTGLARVIEAWGRPTADGTLRGILITLIVIGVLGKSAQIPFQDWLADAMEGPTPASALIHAATMVAAGTVVLAGLFPLLAASPLPRWVLGISVSLTMLLAAVLAFAQSDLKRLLAWSTVSQVGVMLSALAAASPEVGPDAGLFHLWSHAVFKALLFLAIGWAGIVGGGTAARALRGSAVSAPLMRMSFLFGLLSLAGVPLVVGGLSKEHVVSASWEGAVEGGPGVVILVVLLVTAAVTAAYCTRAYLILTAHVRPPLTAPPIPLGVQTVLGVLIGLTVLGGLVLLTDAFDVGSASLVWVIITALVVAVGVAVALLGGFDRDPAEVIAPRFIPLADRGLGADTAYLRLVAVPVVALARLVAFLDTEVVDAFVRGSAVLTRMAGWAGTRAQRGERPSSAVALVLAAAVVLGLAGVLAWS